MRGNGDIEPVQRGTEINVSDQDIGRADRIGLSQQVSRIGEVPHVKPEVAQT